MLLNYINQINYKYLLFIKPKDLNPCVILYINSYLFLIPFGILHHCLLINQILGKKIKLCLLNKETNNCFCNVHSETNFTVGREIDTRTNFT